MRRNFNTSHVTVYLCPPSSTGVNSPISIHLMLLFIFVRRRTYNYRKDFNTSHVTVYHVATLISVRFYRFQYISCYCLSLSQTFLIHLQCNFNTSHVTVYRYDFFISLSSHWHFNTSHVTVYRRFIIPPPFLAGDFNTSHVTVYRYTRSSPTSSNLISIHLMLLFIKYCSSLYITSIYFNTSHVTVYLAL